MLHEMDKSIVLLNHYSINYNKIIYIYYWVNLFPIFNDIIVKYKDDNGGAIWGKECPKILNDPLIDNSLKNAPNNKEICIQAMLYLGDIDTIENKLLREIACKYFYYWICHNIQSINNVQDIKNNYDGFLKIFRENVKEQPKYVCANQFEDVIYEDLEILKYINLMYKKYDRNRWTHWNYSKKDFYEAAINTINKYSEKIETRDILTCESREDTITQILTPCKSSMFSPIIITMVLTLLISISLMIFFKYTKYGSWLQYVILRRTNEMKFISEEIKRMNETDRERSVNRNIRHNILYNSI
ncbi:variable surface protein [Plasmodium gonderi]|uniref:Variable surface protein n=1 Tax=Plasmodium gonderi TaxID=77519 RepID=A0A1Y1JS70_PLAGO|nr:variable surface protein [Plasmodium gonderi]GAW84037.1 variable surface protein [Plasmodium gonderi]